MQKERGISEKKKSQSGESAGGTRNVNKYSKYIIYV